MTLIELIHIRAWRMLIDDTIFVWGIVFVKEECWVHKYLKLPLTLNSYYVKFLYCTMMHGEFIT